jgi:tetratricopeptide (TPR) repeat protein
MLQHARELDAKLAKLRSEMIFDDLHPENQLRKDAIEAYSRALSMKDISRNDAAAAYLSRGNLYAQENRCDLAVPDYNGALALEPQNKETYYHRARCYNATNESDKAIADLDQILSSDEPLIFLEPGIANLERGIANAKVGRHKLAIKDFSESIQLISSHTHPALFLLSELYQLRGKSYAELGELQLALLDYRQALNLNLDMRKDAGMVTTGNSYPEISGIYVKIGDVYTRRKETKYAAAAYKDAIREDTRATDAYLALASLLLHGPDRQYNVAATYAKKAAELTRYKDVRALQMLAEAYFLAGQQKDAIEYARRGIVLDPENVTLKRLLRNSR